MSNKAFFIATCDSNGKYSFTICNLNTSEVYASYNDVGYKEDDIGGGCYGISTWDKEYMCNAISRKLKKANYDSDTYNTLMEKFKSTVYQQA